MIYTHVFSFCFLLGCKIFWKVNINPYFQETSSFYRWFCLVNMNLLMGKRCFRMMNVRLRLRHVLAESSVITLTLMVLLLMIMTTEKFKFSVDRTWNLEIIWTNICNLESEILWLMLGFLYTWGGLLNCIFETQFMLASLISFGVMCTLTGYLLHLTLRFRRFNRKRVTRRPRVRSCLWTQRKVFWLQRGISRSAYVFEARESSIKARVYFGNTAFSRT